ncbi:Uncharacterised protein [Mycobacteroides abscessus subsp. abscessus]|nr:Uncharacterised protein [Mycobacteroides abscessus subsp. abscessus]
MRSSRRVSSAAASYQGPQLPSGWRARTIAVVFARSAAVSATMLNGVSRDSSLTCAPT